MNQEEFARLGGVQKRSQINYEKGERKPDAAYFEGIAAAGANVSYILTGKTIEERQAALEDRMDALEGATRAAEALKLDDKKMTSLVGAILFGVAHGSADVVKNSIEGYVADRLQAAAKNN